MEAVTETKGPAGEAVDDMLPNAAEQAERRERAIAVRQAVKSLPDKLRGVVVCVEFEGLTQVEAARVLGCTAKAVETRLHRARHQLRTLLNL